MFKAVNKFVSSDFFQVMILPVTIAVVGMAGLIAFAFYFS